MKWLWLLISENNTQLISSLVRSLPEDRDTALVSGEPSSTSSANESNASTTSSESLDNDENTSGNLDDGYEQPYTTLVASNLKINLCILLHYSPPATTIRLLV